VSSCRADRSFERAYAYLANPRAEHEAETNWTFIPQTCSQFIKVM
jgi:hypothetical protein